MENLHISYKEVVYKIPYRNLIIMQKDKMHIASGEVVHYITGKERAERLKGR